ncbi:putative Hexose transporter HXT15 [Glarea lozoyensis 74030]|uniref:Putative Hexose transporter HXT15 n=1 Tax=Glarea lozoyensis (strain ATCC 74030 / MF5533) TaxID=1104152 RepID=H0EF01_GLAL7|nr:putative Hexose transporter HXT15 [Glarea lozoyensis 74030]
MLLVVASWAAAQAQAQKALEHGTTNHGAGIASVLPSLPPLLQLTIPAYLIELFPYAERSRGISIEQFFGRGASFFTNFVNPIGVDAAGWKYLLMYLGLLVLEILTIWFFYPETYGRTLEELAFLFEDRDVAEKATVAVEKTIHYGGDHDKDAMDGEHIERGQEVVVDGGEKGKKQRGGSVADSVRCEQSNLLSSVQAHTDTKV